MIEGRAARPFVWPFAPLNVETAPHRARGAVRKLQRLHCKPRLPHRGRAVFAIRRLVGAEGSVRDHRVGARSAAAGSLASREVSAGLSGTRRRAARGNR